MDGATFNWVFTFLALNGKNNKTENYDNIYATLVVIKECPKRSLMTFWDIVI